MSSRTTEDLEMGVTPNKLIDERDLEQLEQMLAGTRNDYMQTPIPAGLDGAVARGITTARSRRRRILRRTWSAAACLALVVAFVTTVRVSSTFAALVSQVPGMGAIVKLIQQDLGLKLAAQNDLMQPIGLSDEHDGIKVTIDGVIMDEVRLNVFYTIERKDGNLDGNYMPDHSVTFESPEKQLLKFISYGPNESDPDHANIKRGRIDFEFNDKLTIFPEKAVYHLKIPGYTQEWTIPFQIDTSKFIGLKETISINQKITVENQSITFKEAVVYPTRILLKVNFDPANTKYIFGFRDLRVYDEQGKPLTSNVATGPDANGDMIYHYESSYYAMPKELYIEGSKLSALDRDKTEVTIDLDQGVILKSPDDRIRLDDVGRGTDMIKLYYSMQGLDADDSYGYSIDGEFHDESGRVYSTKGSGTSRSMGSNEQNSSTTIPNEAYQGPITFKLSNYPSFIEQHFKIRIK